MEDKVKFVNWLSSKLKKIPDVIKIDVKGVSIVPIDRYHFKDNPSIVLGNERAGVYTNKFNFFGGKAESKGKTPDEKCRIVAETLFDETLEELGLILNENLEKCNPYIIIHKQSILFLVFIKNLNEDWWLKLMERRKEKNKSLGWKYQEMSEIKFIPILDIINEKNKDEVSVYVKETINEIAGVFGHSDKELESWEVDKDIFKDTYNLTL